MYEIIKEYIKYISKAIIYWLILNTHTQREKDIYICIYGTHMWYVCFDKHNCLPMNCDK